MWLRFSGGWGWFSVWVRSYLDKKDPRVGKFNSKSLAMNWPRPFCRDVITSQFVWALNLRIIKF